MARRQLGSLAALLAALVIAGCSPGGSQEPATTLETTSSSTSSSTTTTTTTTTVPTTTSVQDTTTTTELPDIDARVAVPAGDGPFPAVVLVHGGSWMAGNPSIMQPLANRLTDEGFLTVNIRYSLASLEQPGFPEAVEDVACAIRYAALHPDSDGTVALVGHSAGAHIGAVVALTGDRYHGGCDIDGPGVPDRFVGLAGPYDVSRLGLAVAAFFGAGPSAIPEAWEAGNPLRLTDENLELVSLIMYGELDGFVPASFAFDFHDALVDSGSTSLLEVVPNARHNDTHDSALVGDLIVTWLER